MISIIIPCFNEEKSIQKTIPSLFNFLQQHKIEASVILVDDGSNDQTWSVSQQLANTYASLSALRLSRNFGKDAAICAGLEHAKGEAVIVMDGDGQHPASTINDLLEAWRQGALIVEARKRSRGGESPLYRWAASFFYMVWSKASKMDMHDASDFILFDQQVLQAWFRFKENQVFFRGLAVWIGYPRAIVWFDVGVRQEGVSHWDTFVLIRLAIRAITSFSSAPLQIVTLFGVIFLCFSGILGTEIVWEYFSNAGIPGFATVNVLILFSASCIMIALGIIGEYLAKIYDEVKRRPRYLIREKIGCATKNQKIEGLKNHAS